MINDRIKTFVQLTLGCGCPEEVFRHIDYRSDIRVGDVLLKGKINIGNRLLIYIVEIDDIDPLQRVLTNLVGRGIQERDSSNLNRFRLVLASDNCDGIRPAAESVFKNIVKDEKVHLHVIPKRDMPLL